MQLIFFNQLKDYEIDIPEIWVSDKVLIVIFKATDSLWLFFKTRGSYIIHYDYAGVISSPQVTIEESTESGLILDDNDMLLDFIKGQFVYQTTRAYNNE